MSPRLYMCSQGDILFNYGPGTQYPRVSVEKKKKKYKSGVNCVTTESWGSKLTADRHGQQPKVAGAQANKCARGTQPTTAAMIRHGGIENGE